MQDDWIKLRTSLFKDGRVLKVSRDCHALPVTVLGALAALWSLGDQYADSDGTIHGWTSTDFDREIGIDGFCESLPEEWIDLSGESIKLPKYIEHNGSTGKKRALDRRRKKLERETSRSQRDKFRTPSNSNSNSKEDNKKSGESPSEIPIWEGCEFFRMGAHEAELVKAKYREKGWDLKLIRWTIQAVDNWLGSEGAEAKKQRRLKTSHHRQLYQPHHMTRGEELRAKSSKPLNGPQHPSQKLYRPDQVASTGKIDNATRAKLEALVKKETEANKA